jgi:TLD
MSRCASRSIFRSAGGRFSFFPSAFLLFTTCSTIRDGQYGLYLDESLLDGSSACCPTFGNDPLCTPGPKKAGAVRFECVGLEVWSIGP